MVGHLSSLALLGLALLPACEAPSAPRGPTAASSAGLNDVQLECRSEKMTDIAHVDLSFGPSCTGDTMAAALATFDRGLSTGFDQAKDEAMAMSGLCLCKTTACTGEASARVRDTVQRVFVDESGKAEREGVVQETNSIAIHPCLIRSDGVLLFQMGYRCGYREGLHSVEVRKAMEARYREVLGDDPSVTPRADECFESLSTSKHDARDGGL